MLKKLLFLAFFCSFSVVYNNEDFMGFIKSLDYLQTLPDRKQEFIAGQLSEHFVDPVDPEVFELMKGCTSTPTLLKHQFYNISELVHQDNKFESQIEALKKESDQYRLDINTMNFKIDDLVNKMNIVMYRHKMGQRVPDFEQKILSFKSELADLNKTLFSLKEHYGLVCEMMYDLENDDSE